MRIVLLHVELLCCWAALSLISEWPYPWMFFAGGLFFSSYRLVLAWRARPRGRQPTLVDLAAHRERLRHRMILGSKPRRPPTGGKAA